MRHEYYYYNKENYLEKSQNVMIVMKQSCRISLMAEMVEEIKRKNALGEKTVFICPVITDC